MVVVAKKLPAHSQEFGSFGSRKKFVISRLHQFSNGLLSYMPEQSGFLPRKSENNPVNLYVREVAGFTTLHNVYARQAACFAGKVFGFLMRAKKAGGVPALGHW